MASPPELREGLKVDLARAARYLGDASPEPAPALWVGKALYAPIHVVEAAVLAAQALLQDPGRKEC